MSFDNYAKSFDTEERINRAKIIANEMKNSICINKNYSAMEFGCGTGLISFNLYDCFKSIDLIDSSRGMLDVLNSKIKKYEVDNMFPYYLDLCSGGIINKKYDIIYNSMVLHHIEDTEEIVKKFYELLNEGGELCIVDLDEVEGDFHKDHADFYGHNGFNQEYLKDVLLKAGFKDIESHTFFHGIKLIGEEKINYSLFLMKGIKTVE